VNRALGHRGLLSGIAPAGRAGRTVAR
jgi:hypothetical protein